MSLTIYASSLLEKCWLQVKPNCVVYFKSAFTGSKRQFAFDQIDAVLLSPKGLLSFQVGREVFSLQTYPSKAKHQEVIDALLDGVEKTRPRPTHANNAPASEFAPVSPGDPCVNHPAVTAMYWCNSCGATICETCAFKYAGGVVVCPTCATSPGSASRSDFYRRR